MEKDYEDCPQTFVEFFKGILAKLKIEQPNGSLNEIYKQWKTKKNCNQSLTQKLAEIRVTDPEDMERLLAELSELKKLETSIMFRMNKIKKVKASDLVVLQQICFNILAKSKSFDTSNIISRLQTECSTNIENQQQFFTELDKLITINIFEEFSQLVTQLIHKQYELFIDLSQEEKELAIKILFERNQLYAQINSTLQYLGVANPLEFLQSAFDTNNQDDLSLSEIETKEQFVFRVKAYLFANCPILIKRKPDDQKWGPKAQDLAAKLYGQITIKNLIEVKQILKESKWPEYKDTQKISDKTIIQIYRLKSIDQFKTQLKQEEQLKEEKEKMKSSNESNLSKKAEKKIQKGNSKLQQINKKNKQSIDSPSDNDFTDDSPNKLCVKSMINKHETSSEFNFPRNHQSEQNDKKSQKNVDIKKDFIKNQKLQIARKQAIRKELSLIKAKTKETQCIQSVLRELQLQILEDNLQKITKYCQKLVEMIKKFKLDQSIKDKIMELSEHQLKKKQRKPRIADLRRKIQILNLEDIIQSKKIIQKVAFDCGDDANAIIQVGYSGVGKTTFIHGATGNPLVYSPLTEDYRCKDPQHAAKFVIGDSMTSQTTQCNNSKIPDSWISSLGLKNVKIIDTPGLNDNRLGQTDIKNNLGTVNVLKKIASGWIVIFISEKQFPDKAYEDIKQFISLISNYLLSLEHFESSISFVLTKGLTKKKLLQRLSAFRESPMFTATVLPPKEERFLEFFEQKVSQLTNQFVIQNPQTQDFKKLVRSILAKAPTHQPGGSIAGAFSPTSINLMKNSSEHYSRLIETTFELGEFNLLSYYLYKIKELDDVAKTNESARVIEKLKANLEKKVLNFQNSLSRFLEYEDPDHLSTMKQIQSVLIKNQNISELLKLLQYSNRQENPKQKIENILSNNFKKAYQILDNPSKRTPEERKICLSYLTLIKEFKSQAEYDKIANKIKSQNIIINKAINEILNQKVFDSQSWQSTIQKLYNQFTLDKVVINDHENHQRVKNIVMDYYDSHPQDLEYIYNLIEDAKTKPLQEELFKSATQFLSKIESLPIKNYLLKEALQAKTKQLYRSLNDLSDFFHRQKQLSMQTLDIEMISRWEIYEENRDQVYRLLSKHQSTGHKIKHQEEFTVKALLNNLKNVCKKLETYIDEVAQYSDNINPKQVHEKLKQIYFLIKFIKIKKTAAQRKQQGQKEARTIKIINQSIQEAQDTIENIIQKQKNISYSSSISNDYSQNYKLIVCLLINMEFKSFVKEMNQTTINSLNEIKQMIVKKLMSPLEQIKQNKIQFNDMYDYKKLYKILKYLKQLDNRLKLLAGKSKKMDVVLQFQCNQQIEAALVRCFDRIKTDFNQFKCIIDLSEFDQKYKNEQDKSAVQEIKTSNLKLLKFDTIRQAAEYIFSFNQLKNIIKDFKEIKVIEEFGNKNQKKCDLKDQIIKRMNKIQSDIQNPKFKVQYVKKNLQQINKQFEFLFGILEKTKDQKDKLDYTDTKCKINELLAKFLLDFKDALASAQTTYRVVTIPVNFDKLKKLTQHSGLTGPQNKGELNKLLESIRLQYDTHLIEISIAFRNDEKIPQKINVFLNIFEFMQICTDCNYDCSLREDLLAQGLQRLFKKLDQLFKSALAKSNKGISIQTIRREVDEYIGYEKRINVHKVLKAKYLQFRKDGNKYRPLLQEWFSIQTNRIQNELKAKYVDSFSLDENLNVVYDSLKQQDKNKIKNSAIQSEKMNFSQLKTLLEDNTDRFKTQYNYKKTKLSLYPSQLRRQIQIFYDQIENAKILKQKKEESHINTLIQAANVASLFEQLTKSDQKKNSMQTQLVKNGLKRIFQKETRQLNFQNSDQFKVDLTRTIQYFEDPRFKSKFLTDTDLKILKNNYLQACKAEIKTLKTTFQNQINQFKKSLNDKNSIDSFKLNKFESTSKDELIILAKNIKFIISFPLFSKQAKQLIERIGKQIEKENQKLKNEYSIMEKLKLKIMMKQEISANSFISNLLGTLISREICTVLKHFNEVTTSQTIQSSNLEKFDQEISNIKQMLRHKYLEAENWDFQSSLCNDTPEKMIKRNQQISNDLKVVALLGKILFSPNQDSGVPENCLQLIQDKNFIQFKQFQSKTRDDIELCFKTDQQFFSERLRHYYSFAQIKKKTQLYTFPSKMRIGSDMKNLVFDRFKQNIDNIQHVATNNTKINWFKDKLKSIADQSTGEKFKIQGKTDSIKQQKDKFLHDHYNQLQNELSLIADDQKKQEKKQIVKNSFQLKKDSKLNDFQTRIIQQSEGIREQFNKKRQDCAKQIEKFIKDELVPNLIINYRARSYFSCQPQIENYPIKFEPLMIKIQSNYGKKITNYLLKCLNQHPNPVSSQIIEESCLFESTKAANFKQLTKGQNFQSILNSMPQFQDKQDDKKILLQRYVYYTQVYQKLLNEYQTSSDYEITKKNIINSTINMGNQLKKSYFGKQSTNQQRWQLIAYIFGVWTILKSTFDQNEKVQFIHKPHGGQVLAIFLLLDINRRNNPKDIEKCMVQVSTGQGKSVILGILSAYLALVGFTVYEACYSFYLSQRDHKDFQNLFINLKVDKKIRYNVFLEICQSILDENAENTLTKKIHDFIVNPSYWAKINNYLSKFLPQSKTKQSILLIDEADVFLNEEYLGQSYYPTISIFSKNYEQLLNKIWLLHTQSITLEPNEIIQMQQFKKVCKQIDSKIFKQIMENQTHAMIRDLQRYKNDSYNVNTINQRIYYKQGDGQSDKIHYGYRTIWAYFHECRITKKIEETSLKKQIFINLIAAGFSYSELPSYFCSILGVTGTLTCMSSGQMQILNTTFGVQKMYQQPSIYPKSNRKIYFKNCLITKIHEEIVNNIDQERSKKKPVVIFFKSKIQIQDFYESQVFQRFKKNAPMITHDVDPKDRDFRIQFSTDDSRITLVTQDFSRGTDFKIKSKDPNKNHLGLHIICAYLPQSFSDYIQLTGRTGRQGKNGSVFIIIPCEIEVPEDKQIISQEDAQKIIRNNDNRKWAIKLQEINLKIENAKAEHKRSINLYSSGTTVDAILQNIQKLNIELPLTKKISKTAICIDGTISMQIVLPKVLQVIDNALPDIYKIIELEKVDALVELKLVIYRNYNSGAQKILQYTNFETQNKKLSKWLNTITADGGWGNEAIQVCFQYVNSLESIHQCIIIGDAIGNTKAETITKRQWGNRSQQYWNEKGYPLTDYDSEVKKLVDKKIKVHSYYLNSHSTSKFFKNLSTVTNGVSEEFKIDQNDATKKFADFVADKVLKNLGQIIGGDSADRMAKRYAEMSKNDRKKYI